MSESKHVSFFYKTINSFRKLGFKKYGDYIKIICFEIMEKMSVTSSKSNKIKTI